MPQLVISYTHFHQCFTRSHLFLNPHIHLCTQLLKENNVVALVRVCEKSYSTKQLEDNGIKVYVSGLLNRGLLVLWPPPYPAAPPIFHSLLVLFYLCLCLPLQLFSSIYTFPPQSHSFQDWEFEDGDPPPDKVINDWNNLTASVFSKSTTPPPCIAVHCVAGLGRLVWLFYEIKREDDGRRRKIVPMEYLRAYYIPYPELPLWWPFP